MTGVLHGNAEGSWRRGGAAAIACLAMGAIFCARPAAAETLVEALSNAYLINPVLNAERANLRATDEQVAVAISGLRPNISANWRRKLPKPEVGHCVAEPTHQAKPRTYRRPQVRLTSQSPPP